MKPAFEAGQNIAMKVPVHEYDQTVAFYKDILGFEVIEPSSSNESASTTFKFGDKVLWIDKKPNISHAEIWLEVVTDNYEAASAYFEKQGCIRRDEIESLPDGFNGFWLSSPANIIHLISQD